MTFHHLASLTIIVLFLKMYESKCWDVKRYIPYTFYIRKISFVKKINLESYTDGFCFQIPFLNLFLISKDFHRKRYINRILKKMGKITAQILEMMNILIRSRREKINSSPFFFRTVQSSLAKPICSRKKIPGKKKPHLPILTSKMYSLHIFSINWKGGKWSCSMVDSIRIS